MIYNLNKFFRDVEFDITYRTNMMSIVPFTGINPHYHSILLVFLMNNEQEESFVWVLETWL